MYHQDHSLTFTILFGGKINNNNNYCVILIKNLSGTEWEKFFRIHLGQCDLKVTVDAHLQMKVIFGLFYQKLQNRTFGVISASS